MTQHARTFNEHLELEIGKHPERTYLITLFKSQPQFSIDHLRANVQAEAEHWMAMTSGSNGKSFLEIFKGVEQVFGALNHEMDALADMQRGLDAHKVGEWEDASKYYSGATSDLHFAISNWGSALHEVADDSPFDPYYPSKAACKKRTSEEPPRSSYQNMREMGPLLLCIFHHMDRIFCLGQELAQRQITCLTNSMQEAEKQYANAAPAEAEAE